MGFSLCCDYLRVTIPVGNLQDLKDQIGGEWTPRPSGWMSYSTAFMQTSWDGGIVFVGTGRKDAVSEVHASISGAVVSQWTYEKRQAFAKWVLSQNGHSSRIDHAFDDRSGLATVAMVEEAVRVGQAVKRSKKFRIIRDLDDDTGVELGYTVYLGSRESQTMIRVYDKAMQQRGKGIDIDGSWVRWELEHKDDRAHAVLVALGWMDEDGFREFLVGVLRSAVDFRDTYRDEEDWIRSQAPLLPWWRDLTEGFCRARLVIAKARKRIEEVMGWATRQLAPMLAVLAVAPGAGEAWLSTTIAAGADRWKQRHLELLHRIVPEEKQYVLKPLYGTTS